jgi:hypothetical protein
MNSLARITSAGFKVWLKDSGNIGICPFSALLPEQIAFLNDHKAEIVKELAANGKNFSANAFFETTLPMLTDQFDDNRRHCHECRNLRSGYCLKQRFRPVDNLPRRCDDFLATLKHEETSHLKMSLKKVAQ